MMDFASSNLGPYSDAAESPLTDAFQFTLDSDDTYVKVSRECVDAVEQFIEILATIQELRVAGRSFEAIAGALNADGIRPRWG